MAADTPPEQVAQVLIGLLPGFVFQHALISATSTRPRSGPACARS
jgi:hypothetical protein